MVKNAKVLVMNLLKSLYFVMMVVLFVESQILDLRLTLWNVCTLGFVYGVLLFILNRVYSVYQVSLYRCGELIYSQILSNLIAFTVSTILSYLLLPRMLSVRHIVHTLFLQTVWSFAWTLLTNKLYFRMYKPKRTLAIYKEEEDLRKVESMHFFDRRWLIEERVRWQEEPSGDDEAQMDSLIKKMWGYEVIFICDAPVSVRNQVMKFCVETGRDCFFVPQVGDILVGGTEHIRAFATPIHKAKRYRPALSYLMVKRLFDIVASSLAIVVLSPFMAITAIAIKLYDHGPALYKQVRLTKNNKPFHILKFRSMSVNAEQDGIARLSTENDSRITPIGKLIRAIRVDELPQLFNILKGDMTIVGPRPERPEIVEQYRQELPSFDLRLQVKAGLTGYAQIYGRYNTEPADKLKMDLMYINHASIVEDLRLIFATIKVLFLKESTSGISEGQVTARTKVEAPAPEPLADKVDIHV